MIGTIRWPRPAAGLVLVTAVIMTAASALTHAAGSAESVEHAERMAVPIIVGPAGALLLLGAAWLMRRRTLRAAWFLALPPGAFVIQELVEWMTQPPEAEPSLLATASIQLAFALLAFLCARTLLRAVRRVVRFLARATRPDRLGAPTPAWPGTFRLAAFRRAETGAHLGRAPPLPG